MLLRYTITSIMATFPMYYIGTRARTASGCEQNVQSDSHGTVYVCLGQHTLVLTARLATSTLGLVEAVEGVEHAHSLVVGCN